MNQKVEKQLKRATSKQSAPFQMSEPLKRIPTIKNLDHLKFDEKMSYMTYADGPLLHKW